MGEPAFLAITRVMSLPPERPLLRQPPPAKQPRTRLWLAIAVCAIGAALAWKGYSGAVVIPKRFNPWAPLQMMAPPNFLTAYKLSRARSDPALCQQALAQSSMEYDLLPNRVTSPGCGFDNAVRLREAGVRLGSPLVLSCPMALSFFMWEHHALQPAAQQYFGQRIVAIEHFGSYACRNINRSKGSTAELTSGTRSRHATANALDIAGFTLQSGLRITVLKDWQTNDSAQASKEQARLLAKAHQGACQFFNGVLRPDYNAMHRNHFHLETGGYAMCR